MGFLIYMLPEHYEPVLVGPHIIAMASAGLAAIIMAGTKHLYGRVRFYHMLLIAAGSASLLGCGLAFILHYEGEFTCPGYPYLISIGLDKPSSATVDAVESFVGISKLKEISAAWTLAGILSTNKKN